jgi:glycosyltransferase involved in cell wall biosynthesis
LSPSLRIAFLVDALTLRARGGDHAPSMARALAERGHVVTGLGAELGLDGADGEGEDRTGSTLERIVRFAPDAVVGYDALSPSAWTAARAARRLEAPLVLVEPASAVSGRLSWRILHRLGECLWGRTIRTSAHHLVAVDPVARDRALAEGFQSGRIALLPAGVDLDHFRPGRTCSLVSRHRLSGRLLLYVGPLEPARDLDVLLRAFGRTVGQRPDWTLVLAGSGSAERRLRLDVERLGLADRVAWLPEPERDELPGLMSASTIFAAPGSTHGIRGRQVARAMACGVPVLAADLPRLGFFVEHERTGLMVPSGDLDAWTEALRRISGSPVARERWGTEARRAAERRLGWSTLAASFEGLLLEARARGAAAAEDAASGDAA